MERTKIDVICPIFNLNLDLFKKLIESWNSNIPIRNLFIGLGKENEELEQFLFSYSVDKDFSLIILDQIEYKTLGYCIQELINEVETEYFVYLHSDVEIPINWFDEIWKTKARGITESLKDPSFNKASLIQSKKYRAYSGAQLILKECVENLNWDNDWVYCNEDLIIQNVVINHGYSYVKVPVYHKHYHIKNKRSRPKETILEWQWKGIIKYAYPTKQLAIYVIGIIKTLNEQYNLKFDYKKFIKETNSSWIPFLIYKE